ncbi:MAG TPA: imidazole glycerol phosphate synthase subunit HisH [Gammaproteobacteria bacterium]|nr:imidazole glycerol phosphate synthase subunit HisH [Gammaproteobacteria bacterium]
MDTVAVIDYGMGNIRSVSRALEHAGEGGCKVVVTNRPGEILAAQRVVFPGVGALRDCIQELQRLELGEVIRECIASRPFLGICLGMQALLDSSEENDGTPALSIVPGTVRHFSAGHGEARLKIPHMGWNHVHQTRPHALWKDIPQDSRFYFVHSYFVCPDASEVTVGTTDYGVQFTSALARGNIFAVQFHPEKSQHVGLTLLRNFLQWDGR